MPTTFNLPNLDALTDAIIEDPQGALESFSELCAARNSGINKV